MASYNYQLLKKSQNGKTTQPKGVKVGPPPLTATNLRNHYERMCIEYHSSPHCKAIKNLMERENFVWTSAITQGFAFALGSMRQRDAPDKLKLASLWQCVLFMNIMEQLPDGDVYIQDPDFDQVDKEFFATFASHTNKSYKENSDNGRIFRNLRVINKDNLTKDPLGAINVIAPRSFVFSPFAMVEISGRIAQKNPLMYFGNGMKSIRRSIRLLSVPNNQGCVSYPAANLHALRSTDMNSFIRVVISRAVAGKITKFANDFDRSHHSKNFPDFTLANRPFYGLEFYWAKDMA
jgi:hypothetical protein